VSLQCPLCFAVTIHPQDIAAGYCPACHRFWVHEAQFAEAVRAQMHEELVTSSTPVLDLWNMAQRLITAGAMTAQDVHRHLTTVSIQLYAAGQTERYTMAGQVLDMLSGFAQPPTAPEVA
jgi:hypothetical protein